MGDHNQQAKHAARGEHMMGLAQRFPRGPSICIHPSFGLDATAR